MTLAERFYVLFRGYEKAFGKFVIKKHNEVKNKQEGSAWTAYEPMLLKNVEEHLNAKCGIGSIPLLEDNTLYFAAIDIDKYDDFDIFDLEAKVRDNQFPLVVCRSKSGGAHLYLFTKEPIAASLVVNKMSQFAAFLGYGGVEIFPKQTVRAEETSERADIGNWINLPYFNSDSTDRFAVHNGKQLSLQQFLDYVDTVKVTEEQLKNSVVEVSEVVETLFQDGPPCLKYLAKEGGFPQGTRNEGMYNAALYLKLRFPENGEWKTKLMEYNKELCSPVLSYYEITRLADSIDKKEYLYKCRTAPICTYCDRKNCIKQKYGISSAGGDPDVPIEIESIQRYQGDPVIWGVEIDGLRVLMTTDVLHNQMAFSRMCLEKLGRMVITVSKNKWEKYIREKVKNADIIPAPEDACAAGQLLILVNAFAYGNNQARSMEEIEAGKPYRCKKTKKIYFQSTSLLEYLINNRFKYESIHHIWLELKKTKSVTSTVKRTGANSTSRVWVIEDDRAENYVQVDAEETYMERAKEVF